MPEPSEERRLVNRWKAGDERAAKELFDTYVDRLMALARRRISQRLASRVDPEDIVQSVFRTFFGRVKAGKFQFQDQDDLCKLLVRITINKTMRQVDFHTAAKRNPGQETRQSDEAYDHLPELLAGEPSPEVTVAFLDQLEHFLGELRPQERQILEMRMQGYSNEEIAAKLDIYDRKIRRVMEHIREVAEEEGLSPGE
jgi:RNA polymerase sigma factor (sigma-70 family)